MKKRRMSVVCLVMLLSALAFGSTLTTDGVAAKSWSIQGVDSLGNVGEYTSIAVDSDGNPHISYFDHGNWNLKYARWAGSTWSITTVDNTSATGLFTSITLDNENRPHIGYFDQGNAGVMHANWTGSTWSIESVEYVWAAFISIDTDNRGYPHMSYRDQSASVLKYANWTGTYWHIETVDSFVGAGHWSSMKVDSNDYPHIAYRNSSGELKYARKAGLAWTKQVVDIGSSIVGVSLSLNDTQAPRISYRDTLTGFLRFAQWNGVDWILETVDTTVTFGGYSSLALDTTGSPRIAYNDGNLGDLKYAEWDGISWTNETLDHQPDVGICPSIALDANNNAHISYRDETNQSLKYARVQGVPSKPLSVAATRGDSQVTLTWLPGNNGGSPITNYSIYRGTSPGSPTLIKIVGAVLSYTDVGLTNGQTYYYHISARNAIGESPLSVEVSATPATAPGSPLNVTAVADDERVLLQWDAPATDGGVPITNYTVYRGSSPGTGIFHVQVGNVHEHMDAGLTNGQTYYYAVSANNEVGEGARSPEVSATPSQPNAVPTLSQASVTPLSGDESTSFTFEVTYSDPDGDNPTSADVIVDAIQHAMAYVSGSNTTGALYRYVTPLTAGTHYYNFSFSDGYGHSTRLPVSGSFTGPIVEGANEPPECSIMSPADEEEVSGTVELTGTASDTDGLIQRVEVRVDTGEWRWATATDSWSYELDTTGLEEGWHTIEARSWDGTDYSSLAGITVIVENPETTAASTLENPWFWVAVALMIVLVLAALVMIWKRQSGGSQEESEENLGQG